MCSKGGDSSSLDESDHDDSKPSIYYLGKDDDCTGPHLIIDWTGHKQGPAQSIECLYSAMKQPHSSEQEPMHDLLDEDREAYDKLQALVAETTMQGQPKFATKKANDNMPRFGLLTVPPMLHMLMGKLYRGEIVPDQEPHVEPIYVEQKPNGKTNYRKQTNNRTKKSNGKATKARKCKTKHEQ